jgi:prepilin-type N-terminal cleavage/methylation domain-containing protein
MKPGARAGGFTLVELMIVVAIITVVAMLAVRSGTSVRGDQAPAFTRSLLAAAHEARQSAMALGLPTRLLLDVGPPIVIRSQARDPNDSTKWVALGGVNAIPRSMVLCEPDKSTNIGSTATTATPVCPIATQWAICFQVNGNVSVSDPTKNCPAGNGGATLYAETVDGKKQYKVALFGLTGLPRLVDTW